MTSDRTLVIVAVIAVVVSVLGLFLSWYSSSQFDSWLVGLSPGATTNQTLGVVNVTIVQNLVINFSSDKIIWGRGNVNASMLIAILDSAQSIRVANGTWDRSVSSPGTTPGEADGALTPSGFVLNNIGNINASIYLKTSNNASAFLGGTNSAYLYNVTNSGGSGCPSTNQTLPGPGYGNYFDVNITNPGTNVCNQLGFVGPNNALRVDIRLVIPYDAPTSNVPKTSTMTATAELSVS